MREFVFHVLLLSLQAKYGGIPVKPKCNCLVPGSQKRQINSNRNEIFSFFYGFGSYFFLLPQRKQSAGG